MIASAPSSSSSRAAPSSAVYSLASLEETLCAPRRTASAWSLCGRKAYDRQLQLCSWCVYRLSGYGLNRPATAVEFAQIERFANDATECSALNEKMWHAFFHLGSGSRCVSADRLTRVLASTPAGFTV